MKILLTILALLNGGYMLLDGVYVILNGKYIGPEKPGPWSALFVRFNMDVFKLGPLFIVFGLSWMFWLYSFWSGQSYCYMLGLTISILTLWYLPVGTILSLVVMGILYFNRAKLII